ncbi:MAG TPA: urease accessory protein UreJ [Gammaproteobacteria bacterium]|nr:urease accessory protein UreJ [Gammaproteobacteria bacterium]
MTRTNSGRLAAFIALTGAAGMAQAHTGHGTHGLVDGLLHPLGADHLLAMLAVGVWSVVALPAARIWQGPACFVVALLLGALFGVAGLGMPLVEQGIALSVVLFGALLVLASRGGTLTTSGLALVAAAAALHGLAHGAEAPVGDFAAYAAGFLGTTVTLHIAGVLTALSLQRWLADHGRLAFQGVGAALGVSGLVLLGQLAA